MGGTETNIQAIKCIVSATTITLALPWIMPLFDNYKAFFLVKICINHPIEIIIANSPEKYNCLFCSCYLISLQALVLFYLLFPNIYVQIVLYSCWKSLVISRKLRELTASAYVFSMTFFDVIMKKSNFLV